MKPTFRTERRQFIKMAGGLTLGLYLPNLQGLANAASPIGDASGSTKSVFEANPFVRISSDNKVTVIAKHLEMGQGSHTGLATLVAEELDADWDQVVVEGAPADAKRYNNLAWGPFQGTGGSTAIANSFDQLRNAGATARAMLVSAAAKRWAVPPSSLTVSRSRVSHPASKRSASFGDLVEEAAALPVPTEVRLKQPRDFVFIGKHVSRKDAKSKSNGTAIYTQDVRLPGMLTAVVAHPPRFGATVKSFTADEALKLPGVVDVVSIGTGVAVLAKDFWSAKKGRDALSVKWSDSNSVKLDSAEIMAQYKQLAREPGAVARSDGNAETAMKRAKRVIEAEFEFPYLAHAPMEPLNCVVRLSRGECEVWNGEQFQTGDQFALAQLIGIAPEKIKLNMLFAGGSFGRRANPSSDYVLECARIAKAINGRAPVKMVWTREDDMRGGYYRPMFFHTIKAGLDETGKLIAWQHRLVGQSIAAGTVLEGMMVHKGIDHSSVEGANNLPYAIDDMTVDLHSPTIGVPVLWWRSVGSSHTAFSTETMIDEAAQVAKKDAVAFRLAMLEKHPRHQEVLKLAASKAGWGAPLTPKAKGERRGRGIAVHESFGSFVAQVVEVTVKTDKSYRVDRVVCAVDCGLAINPDIIRAQMEGGIGFALSAARYGEITLKDGIVEQSNFHDYRMITIAEMPMVEVHIVPSAKAPTGVGEPGVPPLAPALANAIAAATGIRLRKMPLQLA
jgi:isoquinoline 1-oxidoreductase subunit beta